MKTLTVNVQMDEAVDQIIALRNFYKKEVGTVLVNTYHQIGQIIMQLPQRYEAVQELHERTGLSGRTLYYAAVFYEKFPLMENVPNVNWTKIVTDYLPNLQEPKQLEETKTMWTKNNAMLKLCKKCYEANLDWRDLDV